MLAYRRDIAIGGALAVSAAWASYQGAQLITSAIVDECTFDVWFNGDMPLYYAALTNRGMSPRSEYHPLFSLMTHPFVYAIKVGFDIQSITAVRILMAATAGVWSGIIYFVLRLLGCFRTDAGVLTLLAMASAAAMFWFPVPETWPFGSLSILLALGLVAVSEHRKIAPGWYVVASAMTLGTTVTNWMAGIISTAVTHPWKQTFQITINAFCLVIVLWWVEKSIFPDTRLFLTPDRGEITRHISTKESGGPLPVLKAFLFHAMIMPEIQGKVLRVREQTSVGMSVQSSEPGSGSIWGGISVALWVGFLGAGLWGLVSVKKHPRLRIAVSLMLIGQLGLHILYGGETFLYALHWVPLLVTIAAFGSLASPRRAWLALAVLLLASTAINNGLKFAQAIQVVPAASLICPYKGMICPTCVS